MSFSTRSEVMENQVREFVAGLSTNTGAIDLMRLFTEGLERASTMPDDDLREWIGGYYKIFTDFKDNVIRANPVLSSASEMEFEKLAKLSESGIPYWFAQEWFTETSRDSTCSFDTLIMCLPADAHIMLYLWKQVSVFVAITFFTILIGGFTGALIFSGKRLSFKRFLKNIIPLLLCFVLDFIGVISLAVPYIGTAFDIFWAPFSAFLVSMLLMSKKAGLIMFIKEMVPFLDIIPFATFMALAKMLDDSEDTPLNESSKPEEEENGT